MILHELVESVVMFTTTMRNRIDWLSLFWIFKIMEAGGVESSLFPEYMGQTPILMEPNSLVRHRQFAFGLA